MNTKKEKLECFVLDIGFIMILFLITNIIITTVFQLLNIPMSKINLILSTVVTICIFYLFNKKKLNKNNYHFFLGSIIITILFLVVATLVVERLYDTSCDGNFYHKTAIGLIKEGWNPFYESSADFCMNSNSEIQDKGQFLWIDHYPKATWNFAASVYAITNNIESGKVITVLLIASIMCLSFAYFSNRFLKFWQALLISFVLAVNPIVIAQLFTFYVDGIMGLLIYGIILFLIMITDKKFTLLTVKEKWLGLAAEIILCMNIKYTGVYFAAIFTMIFYIFWLVKSKKNGQLKEEFIKLTTMFALIVFVGIIFVGGSTYLKNTIDHLNPLYPLIGEEKVDIVTTMQPQSFETKNRFIKLFESIFANSENITYLSGKSPVLKIPFSITNDEINNIAIPDTRIGGYGVLFSGIFILSLIIVIYTLIKINKQEKNTFRYIIAILIGIVLTTLFLEEAWWARYSPQLYIIPIIAIFNIFYVSKENSSNVIKAIYNLIGSLLVLLMIANVIVFIYWRYQDIQTSKNIKNSLDTLKIVSINEDKIDISFNDVYSYGILYNLRDYDISYKLTDEKESKENYAYNYQIIY